MTSRELQIEPGRMLLNKGELPIPAPPVLPTLTSARRYAPLRRLLRESEASILPGFEIEVGMPPKLVEFRAYRLKLFNNFRKSFARDINRRLRLRREEANQRASFDATTILLNQIWCTWFLFLLAAAGILFWLHIPVAAILVENAFYAIEKRVGEISVVPVAATSGSS
jgi:hypothetical protein